MSEFEMYRQQLRTAMDEMKIDEKDAVYGLLSEVNRFYEVTFPVQMDDGTKKVFKGYRSQHNSALGPTKGGLRFHQDVDSEEVKALSAWMSLKCAVAGIPYGGGKGGITVNPKELSNRELENLSRGFVKAMHGAFGEKFDIPAPDVNTNGQIMSWIIDELNAITRTNEIGTFTGKPIELGGSLGRTEATGYGVGYTTREAAKKIGLDLKGATVVVQGFGNVASYAAEWLEDQGCKVIAIANSRNGIRNDNGIDIKALMKYYDEHNSDMSGFPGAEPFDKDEIYSVECDILLPCALGGAINVDNVDIIKTKLIGEGANGPITPEAEEILTKKGVLVVPDILSNAGGVVVSYFEWVQNLQGYYWDKERVFKEEEALLVKAFDEIYDLLECRTCTTMRTAAFNYAIQRIAKAMKLKGWY
ncbi:MAG: Glu/Leu/Phe/Val family dehydrogenase [Eubacteriaceae bacterium]